MIPLARPHLPLPKELYTRSAQLQAMKTQERANSAFLEEPLTASTRRTVFIAALEPADAALHSALWNTLPTAERSCPSSSPALQHLLASDPALRHSRSPFSPVTGK